jgi:hypothetical protein
MKLLQARLIADAYKGYYESEAIQKELKDILSRHDDTELASLFDEHIGYLQRGIYYNASHANLITKLFTEEIRSRANAKASA